MLTRCFQLAKKLVNSDYKNSRVEDPTKISDKQQKKVKQFSKEFFDKAVVKHRAHEKKRAEKKDIKVEDTPHAESDEVLDVKMSDDEDKAEDTSMFAGTEDSIGSLKRKREDAGAGNESVDLSASPMKRPRSTTPLPPPPPEDSPFPDTGGSDGSHKRKRAIDMENGKDESASPAKRSKSSTPPPPPPPMSSGDEKEDIKEMKRDMNGGDPMIKAEFGEGKQALNAPLPPPTPPAPIEDTKAGIETKTGEGRASKEDDDDKLKEDPPQI